MASSFASQIPIIIHLLTGLRPRSVLDIGKGFGKYGFLLHEYIGVDSSKRPRPDLTLAEQSRLVIDAVESNRDYMWPHLAQIYRQVFPGRIEEIYQSLPDYDVVLMADVIEHLEKDAASAIVRHLVSRGSAVVVSTPRNFFQQELFESDDEHHLSHWTVADFRAIATCECQNAGAGTVFLVSSSGIAVRGFGNSVRERARRIYWAFRNDLSI